jgi:Transglutaminase-like superfamily
MAPYALASHVFVCLQDEHVVFLDVRNDRYFALEAARTRGLDALVRGWPVPANDAAHAVADLMKSGVLKVLADRGLLANGQRAGKDATPIQHVPPAEEIAADDTAEAPAIGSLAVCRFLAAASSAALSLKLMSFESVIRHAHQRRVRRQEGGASVLNRHRAQQLIAIHSWLRPFAFTSKDACLFEALTLGGFLASYGIYPQWVFGVQARPFSAHCWLQHDAVVLNDTVEHVSSYTPLMVI